MAISLCSLQQIDGRSQVLHRERSRPEQTRGGAIEGDEIARVSLQVHHPFSHPLCRVSINYYFQNTLTFQIVVHIRLFIFRNIAVLYALIRVYTFIRFVANPPYTIFIWSMFITLRIFNIFRGYLDVKLVIPPLSPSHSRDCATVLGQTTSCRDCDS